MGLVHLHNDLSITHRDLKPPNILVFLGELLKIADFGISKEHDEESMSLSTKGDRKYAAPEVYLMDVRQKLAPYR